MDRYAELVEVLAGTADIPDRTEVRGGAYKADPPEDFRRRDWDS
jgi:hypothetical protein